MKKKNILVTGGAGFVGSNLISKLLKNYIVYCIDNFYSSDRNNLKNFDKIKNFKFINHDIKEKINLKIPLSGIFHLACPASPPIYQKDPIYTLDTCYFGSRNVLDLALKKKCKVLLASTSEIYGDPLIHPQKESYFGNTNTLGPRACYDEGKRISETLFYEYNRKYGLDIRIARIFNTFGPMMNKKDGRVVSNFINQAINNKNITIYGNGMQTRSFCYIDDLITGLLKLYKGKYNKPINLGNPKEYTMKDFSDIVIKLTNSKSKIQYLKLPPDDPKKRKPNINLAKKHLNWQPQISLKEGLKKTINYYKML